MQSGLTARQLEVLEVIKARIYEIGVPPTQAEIAEAMGFASKNAARDHLLALEKKGYVKLHGDKNRAIQLIGDVQDELPLIGSVAAGTPIEAVENVERMIPIPEGMFRQYPTFLLKVRGDSMQDAGILDGDLIAIKKTQTATTGQIVVARIDNDVTVKRLELRRDKAVLHPENPSYQAIEIAPDQLFIEGHFVGLIRDVS